MSVNFVLTLEHIALVKVTTILISNPDFQKHMCNYNGFSPIEFLEMIEEKISQCELPKLLQKRVINTAKPIRDELCTWKKIHEDILYCYWFKAIDLCWSPAGIINEVETAKRLLCCNKLNFNRKFRLACEYWLTNDVLKLWEEASVCEKKSLIEAIGSDSLNEMVLYKWVQWLQERKESDVQFPYTEEILSERNKVPPPTDLFQKVSLQKAQRYLSCILKWYPTSMKRICLSKIDINGHSESFIKEHCYNILWMFLEWPLQFQFLQMAVKLQPHITGDCFESLLFHLFERKIRAGCKDFDYENLLRDFWAQSPNHLKDAAKKRGIFVHICNYVESDVK
ncbi:uncharacterized protein NPIL_264621 [Nephila pilipes]|uniref:Uncharacterized protein n=1 Tax=Nephila pilipes TaxID=299642 RepID=A0A8X6T2H7_NEPPI|nr:uncharacterized protein NPIL_264621 [Nephila pilipes]